MAFREVFHLLIDLDSTGATRGARSLRTEIDNADGAFNKMRIGAVGAFDIIKQHAVLAGAAAATAIAGFAVDAIGDFQRTALGAGQLSSSLGVTAEEASRLQEVAGDLGIGVETVEKGIGRMNREIANSPEKFDAIGAAIARNKDGTVNVTATFLNVVDALNKIPDPTKRAAAAQEILGRGWQDMSRLITMGADDVAAALQDVESAKIMTPAQVAQAEKFRDTMDELKGIGESVSLALGSELVSRLNDLRDTMEELEAPTRNVIAAYEALGEIPLGDRLQDIIEPAGVFRRGVDELTTALGMANGEITATVAALDPLRAAYIVATDAGGGLDAATENLTAEEKTAIGTVQALSRVLDDATGELNDMASAADNLEGKWAALKGTVSDDQAWIDIQDSLADTEAAAVESFGAASSGAADAAQKARDHQSAVNSLKERVIEYGRSVAGISPRQTTEILAMIDEGRLADAERALNHAARARTAQIRAAAVGNFAMFASGGTVGSDGGIGGESGPEIVERDGRRALLTGPTMLAPGTKVTPVNLGGGGGGGGGGLAPVLRIPSGLVLNGPALSRYLSDLLEQHWRRNGRAS